MKLNHSRAWYEKKAKLEEANHSIAAGKFPAEIFDADRTGKPAGGSDSNTVKPLAENKPATKVKRKA